MKRLALVLCVLAFLTTLDVFAGNAAVPEDDTVMTLDDAAGMEEAMRAEEQRWRAMQEREAQETARRLRELEGAWLFDAVKTSQQLMSSRDNELKQNKFRNKLELQYGNLYMDIGITAANTLSVTMRNRYDDPDEKKSFAMHVEYNSRIDAFRDKNVGVIAIREGMLVFQSRHSELPLLFTRHK